MHYTVAAPHRKKRTAEISLQKRLYLGPTALRQHMHRRGLERQGPKSLDYTLYPFRESLLMRQKNLRHRQHPYDPHSMIGCTFPVPVKSLTVSIQGRQGFGLQHTIPLEGCPMSLEGLTGRRQSKVDDLVRFLTEPLELLRGKRI